MYKRQAESTRVWLHDMTLERADDGEIDIEHLDPTIEAALMAQFRGLAAVSYTHLDVYKRQVLSGRRASACRFFRHGKLKAYAAYVIAAAKQLG